MPATSATPVPFPIPLAEMTAPGLNRLERAVRSERLRRLRRADHEDTMLESLPAEALARLAERLADEVGVPLA